MRWLTRCLINKVVDEVVNGVVNKVVDGVVYEAFNW